LASATPKNLVGDPIIIDESISKFNPDIIEKGDIVGIGITTGNCIPGYRVLKKAKEKGATVIMGGIHSTIFPDEPCEMGADSVITGNGDIAWGVAVKDALERKLSPQYTGGRVPAGQLLEARWDLLDPTKYMFASVQTVVGCPENCSFCSVWVTEGRRPRLRLTDKIIKEVNALYQMGFRYIIFADDNFNPATIGRIAREESPAKRRELEQIRKERLEFFEEYSKAVPKDMYAFTQMTVEVVSDPEYLKAMYEKMRVRAALIGVESFSEEGLKAIHKTWNPIGQKMVETIRQIQDQGIFVLSSIICGLETDTVGMIRTMREFAKNSGTLLAQFTLYSPYPGTVDFFEMMQDKKSGTQKHKARILYDKFWLDPKKPAVLIEHPSINSETLLQEVRNNWNSFYSLKEVVKRARAQNWPLAGKIWFILGSLGFKSLYGGHGLASDSVKEKKMTLIPRTLMKLAINFYNARFRKKSSSC